MGMIEFRYLNEIDQGTVQMYTSQVDTLPATNIQQQILGKPWATESQMVIHSANVNLPFTDTSTGSTKNYPIPSGTYTGSGLASLIQSGLDSVGDYTDHSCTYDEATKKFTVARTACASVFRLLFADATYTDKSVAIMLGYNHDADYTGSVSYLGTDTLGNEHIIQIAFTSTASITAVLVDKHTFKSGALIQFRFANTATDFDGPHNLTSTIIFTATMTWSSGLMMSEFAVKAAKAMQLYSHDRDNSSTQIGRIYAGIAKSMQYKANAQKDITWAKKTEINRTKQFLTESGAAYFDKKDHLEEYVIPIDPLDNYYLSSTVTMINSMLKTVRTDKCLYVTFDTSSNIVTTVYGYLRGNFARDRLRKTPVIELADLVLREQK